MDQENISQLAQVTDWSALGGGEGDKMKNKIRLEDWKNAGASCRREMY